MMIANERYDHDIFFNQYMYAGNVTCQENEEKTNKAQNDYRYEHTIIIFHDCSTPHI